jgi:uncharacterized protein (TIGR00375 family)
MRRFFADLHIHIGRTKSGRPVKITASNSLTIENILYEAYYHKGMDMIGVIDCHVPEVIAEIETLIKKGVVHEHRDGGLVFGEVTLIPGCEIEVNDEHSKGPFHVLAYVPTLEKMKEFSHWLSSRMKNVTLSTQRLYDTAVNVQQKVKELGGIFIPAHVFTPFKSVYGSGVRSSLSEVFDVDLIDAIELGLSSNTEMADQIDELHQFTYVSNSDAHSLAKIAREYQVIEMNEPTFPELRLALKREEGRGIVVNYGLDPKLGKYHQTTCEKCFNPHVEELCPKCGHHRIIKGVFDRLSELKNTEEKRGDRPPYIHQVPLEFIPKLGPKSIEKLKNHFGTEMDILHRVPEEELAKIVPVAVAERIVQARNGLLQLSSGGGGKYGKVSSEKK